MKKIINFFKYLGISYSYLFLFIIAQSVSLIGMLYYKMFTDLDFVENFLEKMSPYYSEEMTLSEYFSNYLDILNVYMEILQEIILPVISISNIFIVIILGLKIYLDKKKKNLQVVRKINIKETIKYIGIGISLNFVLSFIVELLPKTLIESHSTATSFALNGNPLLLILFSGIIAPIAEELIFRYGMMKNLNKINVYFGIIFQAFLFGLLHGNIVQSSYAFILGLIFGYFDYKNNNLIYSIILHIAINTSSVLISIIGINELVGLLILLMICVFIHGIIPNKEEKDIFRKE